MTTPLEWHRRLAVAGDVEVCGFVVECDADAADKPLHVDVDVHLNGRRFLCADAVEIDDGDVDCGDVLGIRGNRSRENCRRRQGLAAALASLRRLER